MSFSILLWLYCLLIQSVECGIRIEFCTIITTIVHYWNQLILFKMHSRFETFQIGGRKKKVALDVWKELLVLVIGADFQITFWFMFDILTPLIMISLNAVWLMKWNETKRNR